MDNNTSSNIHMQWTDCQNTAEEVICGISNDCIILPKTHNPSVATIVNNGTYEQNADIYPGDKDQQPQLELLSGFNTVVSSNDQPVVQDFVEIQVTEEIVGDSNWSLDHTGVVVDVKPRIDTGQYNDDIEIPLSQDQDLYSQMHPFPCDFCSRRFSKKSFLMNHMVSHKSAEEIHDCNLCGFKFHRKHDLQNHMKIHAYAPEHSTMEEDDDDFPRQNQSSSAHKGRRKKSLVPKKNSISSNSEVSPDRYDTKPDKKSAKNKSTKKSNKISTSKAHNYVDEDMRLLSEMSHNADIVPRWPVVDQSRPYVCQHCGVGFAREKALASHSRIHAGDSPFECDVCGEMFWDVNLMREHVRTKHSHLDTSAIGSVYTGDDRFGNFFCEICAVAFHRMDLLKRHRRSHVKAEPLQEISDEDHICTVCGIFFGNAAELRTHAETHRREPEHRCMTCGQNFNDSSSLADHVRRYHSSEQSPDKTCSLCGKVCKDRRSLLKHTCVHSENRTFPCFACSKRFHSRARLRRHMMSHRDKAVTCSDCGEEFPDGRALLSHRHSHNSNSNSLPARSFPCHDCGKTFGSRSSQQIHVRIHTGERPYGCRFCWKAFADGGTLRKHERIHTGEKPYVCPVCPKAFNQRVVLREHIRAHHSGSDSKVNSCYECKVCGYLFGSSSELCMHLVQHSDENTAKHRQPNLGPRKYKRRRKLISHDMPEMSSMRDDDDSSDSSDSHFDKKKIIIKKKSRGEQNQTAQDLETVVKQCESALQNINSMVVKSEPKEKKLKSDKALKKHKTKNVKLYKIGRSEKRAKAAKLLSNTSYASKYVVSRPDSSNNEPLRPRTKNVTYPLLDDMDFNGSDNMRNRPRTKNVNFRNLSTKLEPATFPVTKSRRKRSKKVGTKKIKSESNINGFNEIDPFNKSGMVSEENLETCIVPDFNIEGIKSEIPEETAVLPMDSCVVKSELITCDMCTALFNDHTQLLKHIRVHI